MSRVMKDLIKKAQSATARAEKIASIKESAVSDLDDLKDVSAALKQANAQLNAVLEA